MKPALLIIDVLVDYLDRWPEADRAELVDAIRSLVEIFRDAGLPIVWVGHEFEPDLSDMDGAIAQVMPLSEVACYLAKRKTQS
jgi:nicotinamidase-related amidase